MLERARNSGKGWLDWRLQLVAWLALGILSGCPRSGSGLDLQGGQTGDGSDLDDELPDLEEDPDSEELPDLEDVTTSVLACTMVSTPVDDLEAVIEELGFAPAALLDRVEGARESSLEWLAPNSEQALDVAPERGLSELELELGYVGGAVNLLLPAPATDAEGDAGGELGAEGSVDPAHCPPQLELEMEVRVSTSGGALDERFVTKLRSSALNAARFEQVLELSELAGALEVEAAEASDPPQELSIAALITPYGTSGRINVGASNQTDLPWIAEIARWPAADECPGAPYGESIPIPNDAELAGFSLAEARSVFDELSNLPVHWSDGSSSALALNLDPVGAACVSVYESGLEGVNFLGELEVRSHDARLAGSFSAQVNVEPDAASELGSAGLNVQLPRVEIARARELLGISDVSLDGYDWLSFELGVWSDLAARSHSGYLRLSGVRICPDSEGASRDDSAECLGVSYHELLAAQLGDVAEVSTEPTAQPDAQR